MTNDQICVTLRPLESSDFDNFVRWLNAPHVSRWWNDGTADIDAVLDKYGPRVSGESPTRVYVIEAAAHPIGIVQCYRHSAYPEWERAVGIKSAAGIDYLIGDQEYTGQGVGTQAIRLISQIAFDLFADIDIVVSVPQRENRASCKALEYAAFELIDERKLDSDHPSDAGISCIYALHRPATPGISGIRPGFR